MTNCTCGAEPFEPCNYFMEKDKMEAMSKHEWFDEDVEKVTNNGHENNREIVLKPGNDGSLLINRDDVIALAHEFNLVVYEKGTEL